MGWLEDFRSWTGNTIEDVSDTAGQLRRTGNVAAQGVVQGAMSGFGGVADLLVSGYNVTFRHAINAFRENNLPPANPNFSERAAKAYTWTEPQDDTERAVMAGGRFVGTGASIVVTTIATAGLGGAALGAGGVALGGAGGLAVTGASTGLRAFSALRATSSVSSTASRVLPSLTANFSRVAAPVTNAVSTGLKGVWNFALGSPTRIGSFVVGNAVPLSVWGLLQADEASDGAMLFDTVEGAVAELKETAAAMTDEEKRREATRVINQMSAIHDFFTADSMYLLGLNAAVATAFTRSADDSQAGKNAAIEYHLLNPKLLVTKLGIRQYVYAQLYPGKTEAEIGQMLAEDFVADIVDGANRSVKLQDAGLTVAKSDVAAIIGQHAGVINMIPGINTIRSGLMGVFPELAGKLDTGHGASPVVTAPEAAPPSTTSSLLSGLTANFNTMSFDKVAKYVHEDKIQLGMWEKIGFSLCEAFGFKSVGLWLVSDNATAAVNAGRLTAADIYNPNGSVG